MSKHLSVILGLELAFEDHLNKLLAKAVGFLLKLRNLLPLLVTLILYAKPLFDHIWTMMACTIKPLITYLAKN